MSPPAAAVVRRVPPQCANRIVIADINVLCPFHIPIFVPRIVTSAVSDTLIALRVLPPKKDHAELQDDLHDGDGNATPKPKGLFVRLRFPMNFVTAPLIADLFLLAILAIGRTEVRDGTIGAYNIIPYDIMIFFITLAYIAISIDASGLIRYLAFKVLQWGGKVGHRLFFYLYAFFFVLGSFIGNDPIILSGTAFLAYMTRVSSNIVHPRAWIHTQFAVANIASAILVSSNPTNLVLAGAFEIKFIVYTANMIVPVIVTVIALFPFLLYIVFANESLIPASITMHELSEEALRRTPVNPNIPHARGIVDEEEDDIDDAQGKLLSLEEIMNPFLDKRGAAFGGIVMAATLVTLLALNAASTGSGEHPVFWVTLPAAFVMFCWDVAFGWINREGTREIARKGRKEVEYVRAERYIRAQDEARMEAIRRASPEGAVPHEHGLTPISSGEVPLQKSSEEIDKDTPMKSDEKISQADEITELKATSPRHPNIPALMVTEKSDGVAALMLSDGQIESSIELHPLSPSASNDELEPPELTSEELERLEQEQKEFDDRVAAEVERRQTRGPSTLVSLAADWYRWLQDTFPTVTAVVSHLPFALVPFAFAMFVLVQALVTKGWVQVFAHGWDHWVVRTGTVGSIGGMGFISVVLCNVSFYSPRSLRLV